MKKLRFFVVLIVPLVMVLSFNIILAGFSISPVQAREGIIQPEPVLHPSSVISGIDLLAADPVTGLAITHSTPVNIDEPVYFTGTVTGGTEPIFFQWNFGDSTAPVNPTPPISRTITHTYDLAGMYTVTLNATNFSMSPLATASIQLTIPPAPAPEPSEIFLPTLFKLHTLPEPDLICTYALDPPTAGMGDQALITVQITNKGGLKADGFWVDAYFNPTNPPSQNNLRRWQDACGGFNSCTTGIAWGIGDAPIAPGSNRILVSINDDEDPNTNGYDPDYTKWTGYLPTSPDKIFIYVDSINNNDGLNDGAVSESNEGNNLCKKVDEIEMTANDIIVNQHGRSNLPAR